jgi:hypothetical protein
MKEEGGKVLVMHDGKWTDAAQYGLTRQEIIDTTEELYLIAKLPNKWVFNDFGHMTCYLYRDTNANGRRDANEKIHGDMIHPTPGAEADVRLGKPITMLGTSHGCIHVKPGDIDDMISRKFLTRNNVVVVQPYTETRISYTKRADTHAAPYEVHFYPGLKLICILGAERR